MTIQDLPVSRPSIIGLQPPPSILVKGAAGLGNRMLCVLSAIAYARTTRRELLVDWTDPLFSVDSENVFGRFFDSPAVRLYQLPLNTRSIRPAVWQDHLHLTAMQLCNKYFPRQLGKYASFRLTSVDISCIDYPDELLVFWTWDAQLRPFMHHLHRVCPAWKGKSEFELLRLLAREHLRLQAPIASRVHQFRQSHFQSPTVGIHIRYTDRKTPLQKFHREIAKVQRRYGRGVQLFLATDNAQVEAAFKSRYAKLLTTPKDLPTDGKPLHMDLKNDRRTDRAVEALIDMYLLSTCDHLIYARRSTFSYMAHILSDLPMTQVSDLDRNNIGFHVKTVIQRMLAARISSNDAGRNAVK